MVSNDQATQPSNPANPNLRLGPTFGGKVTGVAEPGQTIHTLRHTYACKLLAKTGNIYLVKEALEHSSVAVTEVYLRFPKGYLACVFGISEMGNRS